jgi:hypothetical protein
MHDHACRFIDHGEIFIFENDVEWNILGFKPGGRDFGEINVYFVTIPQSIRRLRLFLIDENVAAFDQPLQTRARPSLDLVRQKRVESLSGIGLA